MGKKVLDKDSFEFGLFVGNISGALILFIALAIMTRILY